MSELSKKKSYYCVHCNILLTSIKKRIPEKAKLKIKKDQFQICPACKSVYYTNAIILNYNKDYFLDDYKNQYGRSYKDDKEALLQVNNKRLQWLQKKTNLFTSSKKTKFENEKNRVLEIGCALGYFLESLALFYTLDSLDAIKEKENLEVQACEISSYACDTIKKSNSLHKFKILEGSFSKLYSSKKFQLKNNLLCAFYVFEHFSNQAESLKEMTSLLKSNSYLYLALPSTNGPLFQYDFTKWLATHPRDHFADYSPNSLKKILKSYGYKKFYFRPASYHPARAKGLLKLLYSIPYIGKILYRSYCDWFCYGDTMECIALKS